MTGGGGSETPPLPRDRDYKATYKTETTMGKVIHTGDLPGLETSWDGYSGAAVEKFLRETLREIRTDLTGKAGVFHYDAANNRYLVFADGASRDAYLADPAGNRELLLANFDAPFNYTAEINMVSPQYVAILKGATGNYIEFTFDTKNKSSQSVGEDVVCTYTFIRRDVRRTVIQKYRRGTAVRFNVDEYLDTGDTMVTIGIVGQQTLAATTVGVNFKMVDLQLSDTMDIAAVHDGGAGCVVEVPYAVSGEGVKEMEWYLDGSLLPFEKGEDEVTEMATTRIKNIPAAGMSDGTHSLQFRAYTVINGERFYSRTLYREFMVWHVGGDTGHVLTALAMDFPAGTDPLGPDEELCLRGVTQYFSQPLAVSAFNPTYAAQTPLSIYVDGELRGTLSMRNGRTERYDVMVTRYGDVTLRIECGADVREVRMEVGKSATSVEEVSQGLFLALSGVGKSNSGADRDIWQSGGFSTEFNGFSWRENCGWSDGGLVLSGGAWITNTCAPLAEDGTEKGRTIEMEFSTRHVMDNDAVICDLRGDNGAGILVTASEASLTSALGVRVATRYKADERIRLSFVINRSSGTSDRRLAMLYVNGVLSGAAAYVEGDDFISAKTLRFASAQGADMALYSLRFYGRALTQGEVLNNYILYRPGIEEFMAAYDRNNIYAEGSGDLSTEVLSGQLPVMILTGNIPALEATTDKNLQIDVDVEYINLQDPTRSFALRDGALRPQGTSSMSYPKKNFRLYTRKKDTTRLYDADGNEVEDRLYSFKAGAQPVDCWCLKADYAESSGTHNTGVARLWNDCMRNAQVGNRNVLRTEAQQRATEGGYGYDVRTTIDGFPILVFYRLSAGDAPVFIGKYNFNNDKSTESVFGFRDIPGFDNSRVECWEVLNNGHHLALFKDTTNWDAEWKEAFEARYPDGNTDTSALRRLAQWVSTVSAGRFIEEKRDYLDLWKVAAYYIYLMRFGAVD